MECSWNGFHSITFRSRPPLAMKLYALLQSTALTPCVCPSRYFTVTLASTSARHSLLSREHDRILFSSLMYCSWQIQSVCSSCRHTCLKPHLRLCHLFRQKKKEKVYALQRSSRPPQTASPELVQAYEVRVSYTEDRHAAIHGNLRQPASCLLVIVVASRLVRGQMCINEKQGTMTTAMHCQQITLRCYVRCTVMLSRYFLAD